MRIGSLFSGYGGLDMGVQAVLGGDVAWHCEFDANPSRILAHHWPTVPNFGDITAVDWAQVEPVDVITGGFPCQDVSHAGRRKGLIRDGDGRTRSGLWGQMLLAINTIRPSLVVAENVRGLLSATADSDMEPCPWCVGDGGTGDPLRALGAVLGDLADIGYDAAWCGLRAADVGAPHGRFRVFILAWPADTPAHTGSAPVRLIPGSAPRTEARTHEGHQPERAGGRRDADGLSLFRTPTAQLAVNGGSQHPDKRKAGGHGPTLADEIEHLLPTPAVNDMGAGKTVEKWDEWTARMKASHGNGNGHGASLSIEALRMLPTPTAMDSKASGGAAGSSNVTLTDATERGRGLMPTPSAADGMGGHERRGGARGDELLLNGMAKAGMLERFGDYAPAIHRWEQALGRPAPAPTEPTGKAGAHRLSPAFVEWLMGLPTGHVTQVPGLNRNAQLKALGNGVVPQQAATALTHLLTIHAQETAA